MEGAVWLSLGLEIMMALFLYFFRRGKGEGLFGTSRFRFEWFARHPFGFSGGWGAKGKAVLFSAAPSELFFYWGLRPRIGGF